MLRTFAVLLLLLGLATATPVVCLCAPPGAAGLMAGVQSADAPGTLGQDSRTGAADTASGGSSLLATSAAAVVASLIASAAGLPTGSPWQMPAPLTTRWLPPLPTAPDGPPRAPTPPPPR